MMAYSTVMVFIVVSTLAFILLYYHNKHVWEEFDLRTVSLSSALSHDLELLVLLENKKAIERMLEGVLKVQDVVSASVFNKNGKLLVRSGNPSSVPSKHHNVVHSTIEVESDEMTEELIEPVKGKGSEKIGSVEIIFSTLRLKNQIMRMISLVIFFMITIIVLRIISDYFFTRRITNPIKKLVVSSEAVAKGDLTQRIDVKRRDEIGKLASSFNAMIIFLKERDDEIRDHQHQIEDDMIKLDASLKEKELLLKEIHHRVKNNMQVISSMLRLQSRYVNEKKDIEIFKDCVNRIKSMALIHEKLYKSKDMAHIDFKLYIRDLAKELYRSYVVDRGIIALNLDVENIFLGIETAIPCGLIINELIANSLQHAFPGDRKGKISIILRFTPLNKTADEVSGKIKEVDDSDLKTPSANTSLTGLADNKNDFELIVSDNGIGLPKDLNLKNTGSLGLELVHTLTKQLHGEMEVVRTEGTKFKIKFQELKYRERI